jgi:hypothetical protein
MHVNKAAYFLEQHLMRKGTVRYSRLWTLLFAAVITAACGAREPIRFPDPTGTPGAAGFQIPENALCLDPYELAALTPGDRATLYEARYNHVATVFGVPRADIPDTNEAHDCQKTIDVKFWVLRDAYKNIVTLWSLKKNVTAADYANGVHIGGLVNWGPQINDDIVIPEQYSCLIVRGDADHENWHAWVIGHAKGHRCVPAADTLDANGNRRESFRIWRQPASSPGGNMTVALRLVDAADGYHIGQTATISDSRFFAKVDYGRRACEALSRPPSNRRQQRCRTTPTNGFTWPICPSQRERVRIGKHTPTIMRLP